MTRPSRYAGHMGAWGAGVFENDDAADWVWELEDDEDGSVIDDALTAVVDTPRGEVVDAGDASNALAAAEIVAAARGRQLAQLPTEAAEWIRRNSALVTDAVVDLARRAVTRVATSSELRDLWEDAGDPAWAESVRTLQARL